MTAWKAVFDDYDAGAAPSVLFPVFKRAAPQQQAASLLDASEVSADDVAEVFPCADDGYSPWLADFTPTRPVQPVDILRLAGALGAANCKLQTAICNSRSLYCVLCCVLILVPSRVPFTYG